MKKVLLILVAMLTFISCDNDKDEVLVPEQATDYCDLSGVYVGEDELHGDFSFEIAVLNYTPNINGGDYEIALSHNGDTANITLYSNIIGGLWKIDATRPKLDGKKLVFVILDKPCIDVSNQKGENALEQLSIGFEGDSKAYNATRN